MKRYIKSSDEDYDLMQGYKYRISAGPSGDYIGDYDESLAEYYRQKHFKTVYTDDPEEAVTTWLIAESNYPMDAAIYTNKPQYAKELCRWVVDNEPEFRVKYNNSNCSYKYDWLMDLAEKYTTKEQCNSKYGFPDQISPFCYG